jgi:hypothetical protein
LKSLGRQIGANSSSSARKQDREQFRASFAKKRKQKNPPHAARDRSRYASSRANSPHSAKKQQ